ncbi:hypothetical protein AJ78_05794 [Emergomyces pasteurianus Ep9510]|uniref:Uncharacterized protein n=1 Tax=Emergomyces pasteurianus Ep9510 TaxID=1447872 RepID=A0A1J9PCS2_9EURO|nr:hypothetical protein AJ78_05794 [Emergomyces pasteurianus Ep9510]
MPAPLAKGLVITVTILLAAGLAVYENPQVKQWVRNSRRRIAIALHNLGDEINPQERSTDHRSTEDISMSEELGEEAEARRQRAREEILRRASILEARKNKSSSGSIGSFDDLVDKNGRLKEKSKQTQQSWPKDGESQAQSSGVEVTDSDTAHLRPAAFPDLSKSISDMAPKISPEHRQAILDTIDRDRIRTALHSEASSNHPSESLVDLTPTSESPGMDFTRSTHSETQNPGQEQEQGQGRREEHLSQSSYFSLASSQHTEDGEPDFYYARPPQYDNTTTLPDLPQHDSDNPFTDPPGSNSIQSVSSAPSVASSLSHIQNDPLEVVSDGTLSDLESIHDGTLTPASWSEVGSVVSSNDGNHHQ